MAEASYIDRIIVPAIVSAVPGLIVSGVVALIAYTRLAAASKASEQIAAAIERVITPVIGKLDELGKAIGALDKTLAVQQVQHTALAQRVDLLTPFPPNRK